MSNHTPGPWRTDPQPGPENAWVYADEDAIICEMSEEFVQEIRDANARLIAAAPDLLAICREMQEATESFMANKKATYPYKLMDILGGLAALIAKAEGE